MKRLFIFFLLSTFPIFAQYEVGERNPGVAALASTSSDFATGMVEAWPMNEGSGSTFYTRSSSGDNMSASNITWGSATGFSGSVPIFNATNSIATGANYTNTNFDGTHPFSVCAWLNISSIGSGGGQIIGTSSTVAPSTGWIFYIGPSVTRRLTFYILNSYPSSALGVYITPSFPLNAVGQACVTYDGSQTPAGVAIYLNGVSESLTTQTNTLSSSSANAVPVQIGQRQGTTTYGISGTIADITIWDVQKTAAQIASYYAFGPAVP